jgi:hypothetical protein
MEYQFENRHWKDEKKRKREILRKRKKLEIKN